MKSGHGNMETATSSTEQTTSLRIKIIILLSEIE